MNDQASREGKALGLGHTAQHSVGTFPRFPGSSSRFSLALPVTLYPTGLRGGRGSWRMEISIPDLEKLDQMRCDRAQFLPEVFPVIAWATSRNQQLATLTVSTLGGCEEL